MAAMASAMRCSCSAGAGAMSTASISDGTSPSLGTPEYLKFAQRHSGVSRKLRSSVNWSTRERRRVIVTRLDCSARTLPHRPTTEESEVTDVSGGFYAKAFLAAASSLMPLLDVDTANALGGELGLLEGRSVALLHPIVMGGLFAYTLYAGFLGWQWRRVRTIQTDINELKKLVQKVPVAAGEREASPPPPSPVETQINSLTEERKELVKGGFKDKHFNAGSTLLGLGVLTSVGGCLNTWIRTGKLFPGPHLFAGAGITVCWALAAGLVPAMQKGSETARNLHIGLNVINVALFVWQIPTGLEIVGKVFEFAPWP